MIRWSVPENPAQYFFFGCGAHIWTYNPQASAAYSLSKSDNVFVIFSDRARFPTLKDSYSYRFNRALPNPDLGPEHSRNWNIGYTRAFAGRTVAQIEYFRSDLRDSIQTIYIPSGLCPTNTGSLKGTCGINYNAGKQRRQVNQHPHLRIGGSILDARYGFLDRTMDWDTARIPADAWYTSRR